MYMHVAYKTVCTAYTYMHPYTSICARPALPQLLVGQWDRQGRARQGAGQMWNWYIICPSGTLGRPVATRAKLRKR